MTPLLFEHYPDMEKAVPHVPLANLPTPITKMESVSNDLFIKRDDLTHDEYGGNKVRKLEFIIAEALQRKKKEIVTFGAIGTNHGVATALFCKKNNLKCTVILFDQPVTKTVQENLRAMVNLGANLVYKKSIFAAACYFYAKQLTASREQYFLFAGGSNVAGCLGFVNAAFELKQQISSQELPKPHYIYCPIGSSATLAGLTLGCFLADIQTKVIGVRVAPSHVGLIPSCSQQTITKLMQQTYEFIDANTSVQLPNNLPMISMQNDYYGAGYGVATTKATAASKTFHDEGINLDKTYTAKTAAALLDHFAKEPEKNFLYWHTFNSANMRSLTEKSISQTLPRSLQTVIDTSL